MKHGRSQTEVKLLKVFQGRYALCKFLYSLAFSFPKRFLNTKKGSALLTLQGLQLHIIHYSSHTA